MMILLVIVIVQCLLCYSIVRGGQIRGVKDWSEVDVWQDSEASILANHVPTRRGLSPWSENKDTTAGAFESSASIFSIAFERVHREPDIINKSPQVTEDVGSENANNNIFADRMYDDTDNGPNKINKSPQVTEDVGSEKVNDNILEFLADRVYGDIYYGTLNPIIIESPTPSPDGASMSPVSGSTTAPSGSHFPSNLPTHFAAMTDAPTSVGAPSGSDSPSGFARLDTDVPTSVAAPSGSNSPSGFAPFDTGAPSSVGAPSGSDAPSGFAPLDTGAPSSAGAPSGSHSPSGSTLPSYAGTDAAFL